MLRLSAVYAGLILTVNKPITIKESIKTTLLDNFFMKASFFQFNVSFTSATSNQRVAFDLLSSHLLFYPPLTVNRRYLALIDSSFLGVLCYSSTIFIFIVDDKHLTCSFREQFSDIWGVLRHF